MKFAATFGGMYNYDDHPMVPDATGNSYLVVEAADEMEARQWLYKHIDNRYAFIYEFDEDFAEQIVEYDLHEVQLPEG